MKKIPSGWSKDGEHLVLVVKCVDFMRALAMLNSIADIAQSLGHHPDLSLRNYNEVIVSTTTHEVKKLTEKDYQLAQEITDLIEYHDDKELVQLYGR